MISLRSLLDLLRICRRSSIDEADAGEPLDPLAMGRLVAQVATHGGELDTVLEQASPCLCTAPYCSAHTHALRCSLLSWLTLKHGGLHATVFKSKACTPTCMTLSDVFTEGRSCTSKNGGSCRPWLLVGSVDKLSSGDGRKVQNRSCDAAMRGKQANIQMPVFKP